MTGQRVTIQIPDGPDITDREFGDGGVRLRVRHRQPATAGSYNLRVSTSAEAGIATSEAFAVNDPPDTAHPITTLLATPAAANGDSGWYVVSPQITLSADEPATTSYRWDGGTWETYLGSAHGQ